MAKGHSPVPEFVAPKESQQSAPDLCHKYPLALLSPKSHAFVNSSFANQTRQLNQEGEPFLEIHPEDAAAREIENGAIVRVYNERGSCKLRAVVTTRAREGVVISPSVWWNKLSSGKVNVNQLTSQNLSDMGGGATLYDALVEVEIV
jgi:anaerobic selenocysteine-containing dehydrogenase